MKLDRLTAENLDAGKAAGAAHSTAPEPQDAEVIEALRNFRLSVHAWSDAVYSRPRPSGAPTRHSVRRAVVGWALGCCLAVMAATGGAYEFKHQRELARLAAAQEAEHHRQLAEQHVREVEDLLAKVDRDISQQVPDAMEPLAQLMVEDETQ